MAWWRARNRRFRFLPTLTREEAEGHLHGRIPDILPDHFPDLSHHSVFIAGTPEFVEACVAAVKRLGARPELIHTEGYFSQQAPEEVPKDRLMAR